MREGDTHLRVAGFESSSREHAKPELLPLDLRSPLVIVNVQLCHSENPNSLVTVS